MANDKENFDPLSVITRDAIHYSHWWEERWLFKCLYKVVMSGLAIENNSSSLSLSTSRHVPIKECFKCQRVRKLRHKQNSKANGTTFLTLYSSLIGGNDLKQTHFILKPNWNVTYLGKKSHRSSIPNWNGDFHCKSQGSTVLSKEYAEFWVPTLSFTTFSNKITLNLGRK